MSTTVTISPNSDGSGIAALAAGSVAVVGSVFAAVLTDDAECKRMLEQARQEQQAQRLASVNLRTPDLRRLAQSAREAHFTVLEGRNWLRIDVPGQRVPVWVAKRDSGVTLAGGRETLQQVLVANSVSRLSQPLVQRGFTLRGVASQKDFELVATNQDNLQLRITVASSGDATVDAVNYHGKECEEVVKDLAAAVDGSITAYHHKPEYFGGACVRIGTKQHV